MFTRKWQKLRTLKCIYITIDIVKHMTEIVSHFFNNINNNLPQMHHNQL